MAAVGIALIGIGAFMLFEAVKPGNTNPTPLANTRALLTKASPKG